MGKGGFGLLEGFIMKKDYSSSLYKRRLLVMIFINWCPVFHLMRNNKRILHFYYYVCFAEIDKVKDLDSELLRSVRKEVIASKNSFDRLYAVANFMNTREYKEAVAAARREQRKKRIKRHV